MNSTYTNDIHAQKKEPLPFNVLFVDDEIHILSALKRVFRGKKYIIHTAESAKDGLSILEEKHIDLVVSDMRMPEISGAEFLSEIAQRWPNTIRILLTGYSDMDSTISAVNSGQIFRYVSKPWDDAEIKSIVNQGLDMLQLKNEKNELEKLTEQQNAELKQLNASLEEKVKSRTNELEQTVSFLELTQNSLTDTHFKTVQLMSNVIELRRGMLKGHAKKVSSFCAIIAKKLHLSSEEILDLQYAAFVHELGTISLPVNVFMQPTCALDTEELEQRRKIPLLGESILMGLSAMDKAAKIVRHHFENFDGTGYPDKLKAENIPIGSRILHVANIFYRLKEGREVDEPLTNEQAITYITKQQNHHFDPKIVDTIRDLLHLKEKNKENTIKNEEHCATNHLKPGMILSRSVIANNELFLLHEKQLLNDKIIQKLQKFESASGIILDIYIIKN